MEIEEIKKFIANLDKLKRCGTLPKDDLKGRYFKAYQNLKNEISIQVTNYVKDVSMEYIKFSDKIPEIADDINKMWKSPAGRSMKDEILTAVWRNSFKDIHRVALIAREQVKQIAWNYAEPEWNTIEYAKPIWMTDKWKEIEKCLNPS